MLDASADDCCCSCGCFRISAVRTGLCIIVRCCGVVSTTSTVGIACSATLCISICALRLHLVNLLPSD